MQFSDALSEILRRVDIVEIARDLSLAIGKREAQYTTARCPFHDDKTPSLALYRDPGNPHYYCFACGARGGVLDLVEKQRRGSRAESLIWLAQKVGVELPDNVRRGRTSVTDLGSTTFSNWLKHHQSDELLQNFAKRRRLDVAILVSANAFAVDMSELKVDDLPPGERMAMERAGVLATRRDKLMPVATGKQIVFPLEQDQGFIFRALDELTGHEKARRYRFSKGLRKSEILFGAAAAEQQIAANESPDGVFVVEGLMDVLRLRSLGLAAVAILGTAVSSRQAELIQNLCGPKQRPVVPAHLFLDGDDAGRRAAPTAIRMLMGVNEPMPLDIVRSDGDGDPDELLAELNPEAVRDRLSNWTHSVLAVLAHHYSRLPLATVLTDLPKARPLLRVETLRYIAAQFAGRWSRIRDLADPGVTYLGRVANPEATWLREALDRAEGLQPEHGVPSGTVYSPVAESTDEAHVHLRRALRLAQSSNFRREYPFDWGGMTRLALAANATSIVATALLAEPDRRPIPYPARLVPKDDGRTRLKAGPWPEDALVQQYVLSELLRARPDVPGWYLEFPAVRLVRTMGPNPIVTGPPWLRPVGRPGEPSPVVSFAYQIDQEIVEGDAPPRREGMFVPYRECWQQFIDHLDGFVARQPLTADTFYAVRLDISGFYDNLPRYAVDQVLQPAIAGAVERYFTGRDFTAEVASLLQPQSSGLTDTDNQKRAELVARWLSDQSFGYRYFDPSDGSLAQTPNSTVGIPQGPDLSAFLANLALYPVDRAVTEAIATDRHTRSLESEQPIHEVAVYGRYVDDMVIISTSQHLLSRIEAIIGQGLRDRGLSMNAKHERTKALNRRKIREWLLGERGAAVFVSAGGEETPTTSRASVEELLDIGPETARSQVLQLLHSDDLYSPRWARGTETTAKVDATLQRLRALPSVKLRYYDWVSAARWVMHSLANQMPEASAEIFADHLIARWRNIYGQEIAAETFGELPREREVRQEYLDLAPTMMLFDALERSIDSRHDRRGQVDIDTRHALKIGREKLSRLVHQEDLSGEFLRRLGKDAKTGPLLHRVAGMLQIQHLGIRGLAGAALGAMGDGVPVAFAPQGSYAERRFAINALGMAIRRHATPILRPVRDVEEAEWSPEGEPLLGLHEALARLMADGTPQSADPLAPISEMIGNWLKTLFVAQAPGAGRSLKSAVVTTALVDQFLPTPTGTSPEVQAGEALRAFVEVVAGVQEGHALLAARKHLVSELSDGNLEVFAVPPGIDAAAFFARDAGSLKAFAFFGDGKQPVADDVLFGVEATGNNGADGLAQFDCRYPESHRISTPQPQKVAPASVRPADLRAFAKAYRDLVDVQSLQGGAENGYSASPHALTPFHLLEPIEEGARWVPFGARARLPIGPQAFVRLGEERLHSIAVYANGAHLWQVGFTLADNLGYRGFARSSELDRLTVATLEPTDTAESIPFYVMQLTVPRLCGAYLARSRFSIDPAKGLPVAIERQLARLEAIQDGTANSLSNLTQLLEAGAEARAAELLREAPAPLQVAGALSAVFRSLGRAASRSERIFTQNLPPAATTPTTHRRTVDLWLAAASRLDGLAPAQSTLGLRSTAAAIRLLAVAKLAQALTLEVWSLLSDDDWQQFAHYAPNLTDFELPDEALLIAGGRMQRSAPVADQAVKLIGALRTHAVQGATARAALDQITPLGWVVALATATGLLELDKLPSGKDGETRRPELLAARGENGLTMAQTASAGNRLWEVLFNTAQYLARGAAENTAEEVHTEDWPWSAFRNLVSESAETVGWMIEASRIVEALYDLRASTHISRFFQIADADERGYCLVLRDGGRQNLAGWQIDRDSLGITRTGDLETRDDPSGGVAFVWSETTHKERLIALSVGYRSLAELASLGSQSSGGGRRIISPEPDLQGAAQATFNQDHHTRAGEVASGDQVSISKQTPAEPLLSNSGAPRRVSAVAELASQWHAVRRAVEERRTHTAQSVAVRIALLQLNIEQVGHSFYHPICEVAGGLFANWEPFLKGVRQNGVPKAGFDSHFEAWRRAILTEALERCRTLKVELLILPEYTIRPDTVAWLAANLDHLAPETSILAGTFRQAARAQPLGYATGTNRRLTLGAVVPLIVPGATSGGKGPQRRDATIYSRLKKYPSTGLSEFMRPEDQPLRAVYDTWPGARPVPESLRYVRDLICSEVFLAMSPANIYSCVPALMDLHQRFGNAVVGDQVLAEVMRDIQLIAQDTSPAIRRELANPRKTIMAVPAATTRPLDHHIFGEAGAKAAGLTTVFANMAGGRRGESCFIGHYKADCIEGSHVWGLQSPYHGRGPGIWSYRYEGGQPLGSNETALLVADVNPIDTNVSKPARQIESLPISLVAHIPFFLEFGPKGSATRAKAEAVAEKILRFATTASGGSSPEAQSSCELDTDGVIAIRNLADELASVDRNCEESLKFRAQGAQAISMQPHVHPIMPILSDWAFVPAPTNPCVVEVPDLDAIDLESPVAPE